MKTSVALVVSIAMAISGGAVAMRASQSDVDVLQNGTLAERHDALVRLMKTPPSARSAATWQALGAELSRLLADARQRISANAPTPTSEALGDYYGDLVEANSQSRSPLVIPLLVQVTGTGRDATDALARFGDLAVQPLLDKVAAGNDELSEVSGAIFALARMVRGDIEDPVQPLSTANRATIVNTARMLMNEKLADYVLPCVVLALSTRDPSLRETVVNLAVDSSEWNRHGVTDLERVARYRSQVQVQLGRFPL